MVKPIARGLLVLLLLAVLSLGGAALWLKGSARDMAWAKPWLMAMLNPPDAPYSIDVAHVAMDWRHVSQFGTLSVERMTISQRDGTIFAIIPHVQVTLDPLGFLPHHRGLNSVILASPKLFLVRGADEVVRLGLDSATESLPLNEFLGFFVAGTDAKKKTPLRLPFRAFAVENASLTMQDESSGVKLTSAPFSFRIARELHNSVTGALAMPFVYDDEAGRVDATLTTPLTSNDHQLGVQLQQFPTQLICLFANCPNGTKGEGKVSGRLNLRFDEDGFFQSADIAVTSGKATLTAPDLFAEPLDILSSDLIASVGDAGNKLTLDHIHIKFKDTEIMAQGAATKTDQGWQVKGDGTSSRLDVTKLYRYWPVPLAKDTRNWVITKLKAGVGTEAKLAIDFSPQEITSGRFNEKSLTASLKAEDATIEYLPGFPELKHVNGTVQFTGKAMHIVANSGSMLSGTSLSAATLDCELDNPKAPMQTVLTLSAPAADAATVLSLPAFTFTKDWKLDPLHASGNIDAVLKLGFEAFSNSGDKAIHLEHVNYDISANLKQVAQPAVFGRFDIRGLDGTLLASNRALKFNGKLALAEGTGLSVALAQDAKGNTTANFSGRIPRKSFAALGIPDKSQLGDGTIGVVATLGLSKEAVQVKHASIDLTDLTMNIPEITWSKTRGERGMLILNSKGPNDYALSFAAQDLHADDGTLRTNVDNDLQTLSLPHVVSDLNDFAFDYAATADGFTINLTGKRLDASGAYAKSDNHLLADFPPITLNIDLDEVELMEATPLLAVKGQLTCNRLRCESADIQANVGRGTLHGVIDHAGGVRQLLITSNNAGDLVKALNISDRLYNGTLTLRGSYDDRKQPAPFNGALTIEHYTLKNSEILGRILSIASITGLANALTGSGIDFEKMVATIHHLKGVVTLDDGRSNGASLGITVEGKIDTTTTNLDLHGVLVPAYFFNSIVTKIPLIGRLAGGKGEGLIAFNYAVHGKYSDPKVSVNPLSGLTPGFLRGIFGVFDNKGDDKTASPAAPAFPGDRPPGGIPVNTKDAPVPAGNPSPAE